MKLDINSLFPKLQQVYPQRPVSKNDSQFDNIKMMSLMHSPEHEENEDNICFDDGADMTIGDDF